MTRESSTPHRPPSRLARRSPGPPNLRTRRRSIPPRRPSGRSGRSAGARIGRPSCHLRAATPRTRARRTRAQTRARLLQAASEVFAKHGYDRASLDDVAAAAGLTKGAVYSSFASKDELFYALMRERIDER